MRRVFINTYLFIVMMGGQACDTRTDFNKNLDQAPTAVVRPDDPNFSPLAGYATQYADSMKLDQNVYCYDVLANSILPNTSLNFQTTVTGGGAISTNNAFKTINSINQQFLYKPNAVGQKTLQMLVQDAYGLNGFCSVQLTVFYNLTPVAIFSEQKVALLDPLQCQFDASGSYDKDARFGGKICHYEFTISPSYRAVTNQPLINYIFPKVGNYQVALRVQDNDSAWSPSTVMLLNVQ